MKKVAIIGKYIFQEEHVADGQSVKTRILTKELEKVLGSDRIEQIDTYGWRKNPVKLLLNCLEAMRISENVVFMTDEGGIKVFPWLLRYANILYKRKIHYVVIGGWLVPFLEKHAFIAGCLKKFDWIFPETTAMCNGLEALGFTNVCRMPNVKNLSVLPDDRLVYSHGEPYAFCTFSRVMREKGIGDAVNAVRSVNERFGRTVCTLDIYGLVEPEQKEWFAGLMKDVPPEIRYCGVVPFDRSVEVIREYFALLFPTSYTSEGIPGTIIDAYAAGVPVIASKWSGYSDVVDEAFTGIGYPWLENDRLESMIIEVLGNPDRMLDMKKNCLRKAAEFMPENVMGILLDKLE